MSGECDVPCPPSLAYTSRAPAVAHRAFGSRSAGAWLLSGFYWASSLQHSAGQGRRSAREAPARGRGGVAPNAREGRRAWACLGQILWLSTSRSPQWGGGARAALPLGGAGPEERRLSPTREAGVGGRGGASRGRATAWVVAERWVCPRACRSVGKQLLHLYVSFSSHCCALAPLRWGSSAPTVTS